MSYCQQLQPVASSPSSTSSSRAFPSSLPHRHCFRSFNSLSSNRNAILSINNRQRSISYVRANLDGGEKRNGAIAATVDEDEPEPTMEDLEYISQVKRVLELLKNNRDMLFGEVKLTIMIEDPREVERRRLLGIDDSDAPTRDDLVEALEEVNEGKVPINRIALRMLAEEMTNWPNLEAEAPKKTSKGRSLYAKATDTGVDPDVAAKRLNVDWDSAAQIEEVGVNDETDVPPALGR